MYSRTRATSLPLSKNHIDWEFKVGIGVSALNLNWIVEGVSLGDDHKEFNSQSVVITLSP